MCATDAFSQSDTSRWLAAQDRPSFWGKSFLHPGVDFLLIAGGLSLLLMPLILAVPTLTPADRMVRLIVFLLFNGAHFASSSVRLYTKQGVANEHRFLAYGTPLVGALVVTLSIYRPEELGTHLWALFMTWSPYHYAAQAFGLAVMYCYRSGVRLEPWEKKLIWWVAMVPFVRAFLMAPEAGLEWFVPQTYLTDVPAVATSLSVGRNLLAGAVMILPLILFFRTRIPIISVLLLVSNGMWWLTLSYSDAWFWAAIFHSIQYLGIVMYVHAQDRQRIDQQHAKPGWVYATRFYLASSGLALALFVGWPLLYNQMGFGFEVSYTMVAAAVSIHHFLVDGYIWRSPKRKPAAA